MTIQTTQEFRAERNRQICELAATHTRDEIAKKFGCCTFTVDKVLRAAGRKALRPTRTGNLDIEARNKRWIEAYESGEANASELAQRDGISRERVCQILRPTRAIEKRIVRKRLAE